MNVNIAMNEHCLNERVLILNGSPHANGSTSKLIAAFREGLSPAAQVEQLDCFSLNPIPCDGCNFCHHRDGCSKRDLDGYYASLESADILVFALPVYNLSFPAPMKALLDRGQRYWSARFIRQIKPPIERPKKVILMTVSGDSRTPDGQVPEGGRLIEQQLRLPLTVLHGKLVKSIHYFGSDAHYPIEPFLEEAKKTAKELTDNTI